ncbi:HAMP domain-containing sensor histidine kinase [Gordonia westfalica]|uniref:histidine kinase n=1 Tax=Gordonia westfalica TaxID=158898 RepID=A0ABU2GWC5_9ACTN|nr:HAMP domain-containing sensor histidine kinase [Gordonia westfalica]MDS1115215.1 HAMP domain-containing sensor histidine kinase [Gordonia westfalica]
MARAILRRRRSAWSIRTRLVAALLAVAVIGFVTFGVISTIVLERLQEARIDAQLDVIAHDIGGSAPPPSSLPEQDQAPSEFRLLYFDSEGRLLTRLGAPVGASTYPQLPDMSVDAVRERGDNAFTVGDERSDIRWRVRTFVTPTGTADDSHETAAVAISMETADSTIAWLRWTELIVGTVLLVGMTLVAAVLARIGLRPLADIEQAATSISAGQVTYRVSVDGPSEVAHLGEAFNSMLDRLAEAMDQLADSEQRMRTFVADASHDLRTPLTAIRGYAELYRYGVPDGATRDEIMGQIEIAASRMSQLVDDLVELAQYDDQPPLTVADVDVARLVREVVDEARLSVMGRDLTIDGADSPVIVRGDETALRRVCSNLITNALVHTNGAVRVVITDTETPPEFIGIPVLASAGADVCSDPNVSIYVCDTGPGVPPDKAQHVFERFYQADVSRERGAGSGLGLAIVAAVLEVHGGRVELLDTRRGATFRVLLPAIDSQLPASPDTH